MVAKHKTQRVARSSYVNFLQKAAECRRAAARSLAGGDWNAAAICAIHGSISACDALSISRTWPSMRSAWCFERKQKRLSPTASDSSISSSRNCLKANSVEPRGHARDPQPARVPQGPQPCLRRPAVLKLGNEYHVPHLELVARAELEERRVDAVVFLDGRKRIKGN